VVPERREAGRKILHLLFLRCKNPPGISIQENLFQELLLLPRIFSVFLILVFSFLHFAFLALQGKPWRLLHYQNLYPEQDEEYLFFSGVVSLAVSLAAPFPGGFDPKTFLMVTPDKGSIVRIIF